MDNQVHIISLLVFGSVSRWSFSISACNFNVVFKSIKKSVKNKKSSNKSSAVAEKRRHAECALVYRRLSGIEYYLRPSKLIGLD